MRSHPQLALCGCLWLIPQNQSRSNYHHISTHNFYSHLSSHTAPCRLVVTASQQIQTFAGRLRDCCRVEMANRIDHNTVLLNSLETQLCTSVVINSNCTPSTNLKTSVVQQVVCKYVLVSTIVNTQHRQ